MDETISQLMSLGTVVLALSIYILTTLLRRLVETWKPKLKQKTDEDEDGKTYGNPWSRWYNKVIVYFLPPLFGAALGVAGIPFLFGDIEQLSARILYGVVVGYFSGSIYKVVSSALRKQVASASQG
jgi:Na+/H+ antiporter NhaA